MTGRNWTVPGLRPRVKHGRYKDKKPIGLPPHDPIEADMWRKELALKGQNDYIGKCVLLETSEFCVLCVNPNGY